MRTAISIGLMLLTFVTWASRGEGAEPSPSAAAPSKAQDNAAIEAQRQKIWNSAPMLRARAWLEDYFETSAKITPAEAQEYREHLAAMTPVQMKLWLLKFEEEEQGRKQVQAVWQQGQQAAVAQDAVAVPQQAAAGSLNSPVTAAAAQQQRRMAAQRELENQMILQQQSQGPYGYGHYDPYYGYRPYGAPYPGYWPYAR
jgi:hypothetical protein